MHSFLEKVQKSLRAAANPDDAEPMARYMKNLQPFLGIKMPMVKSICREALRAHPVETVADLEQVIESLWAGPYREERYAAIRIAQFSPLGLQPGMLSRYEWMIASGQWWDLVDPIATFLVGELAARSEASKKKVFQYIASDNMWLRRTALIFQLKYKGGTDWDRLQEMILGCAEEKAFFIRKAIGWALREYSKTDAEAVSAFVAENRERLSPLSQREALKWLRNRG